MIKVYGASDDLIEVEGDIDEEFYAPNNVDAYLAFSNGVVLKIKYDNDGIWKIRPVVGSFGITHPDLDDYENYSDVATVAEATWVVMGTEFVSA